MYSSFFWVYCVLRRVLYIDYPKTDYADFGTESSLAQKEFFFGHMSIGKAVSGR